MSERLNLIVDDGIGAMLAELAEGERKRGQWITSLVRSMHEQRRNIAVTDIEEIRMGFAGLVASVKMLEGRTMQLEQQLAALIAERST